jgi:dipeptidase D
MPTFVSDLEPRLLWGHFDELLATPRPSRREAALREKIRAWAAARGCAARTDAVGNLVVAVPASAGRERAPAVVLQSHLDMVCERDGGVAIDFERDGIVPRREGDWLYATGTTLGADNGIGVAAMLALAEAPGVAHGPLELLFTVEEEIGLNGACALDPALVTGRTLLNLDTEEEGSLYVGCAGGAGTALELPLDFMFGADGRIGLLVEIAGLRGGHSGVDIHLQRGNAIAILARALHGLWRDFQFELAELAGGNLDNAIPREARAAVRIAAGDRDAFARALAARIEEQTAELLATDPDLRHRLAPAALEGEVFSDETTERALALLAALPHGVVRWSDEFPDLVESSTNLARVRTEGRTLRIAVSNRSSVDSALAALQARTRAFGELAGAETAVREGYPGWRPDPDSPLLALVRAVHARVLGAAPKVKAIHAGLECGVLGARLGGADMVSLGPQIEHPHSPSERVLVPSVERFWRLLVASVEALAA